MKTVSCLHLVIPVVSGLIVLTGCNKPSEPSSAPTPPAPPTAATPSSAPSAPAAPTAATPAPAQPKATVAPEPPPLPALPTQATTESVKSAVSATAGEVEALLNSAKAALGEKKWTELTQLLQQLAAKNLTPEQQQLVAGWKKELEAQLTQGAAEKAAGDAASKVKGLLNK